MKQLKLVRHPETNEIIPEIWEYIEGYSGFYEVSNYGRIRSWHKKGPGKNKSKKANILVLDKNKGGYNQICLVDIDGRKNPEIIHRLVAKAFIPNPENKPHINHRDGDKTNNHTLNLEWCTPKENVHHAKKMGLCVYGEKHGMTSLTKTDVLEIRWLCNQNWIIQKEIAKIFNITESSVCDIKKRRTWTHI